MARKQRGFGKGGRIYKPPTYPGYKWRGRKPRWQSWRYYKTKKSVQRAVGSRGRVKKRTLAGIMRGY